MSDQDVCSLILSQDAKNLKVYVYKPKSYKESKKE